MTPVLLGQQWLLALLLEKDFVWCNRTLDTCLNSPQKSQLA